MSLSATQNFYADLTKSGSGGVTGKSGSINFHLKKLTRASTPTITTVTTGGGITVGSVTEVDSTNAPGLYVVGVTGLDPAADYLANFHYTGTATDVDQVDVPSLWSEFSMAINGGAVPQAQAAAVDGLATLVTGDGTTPVVPSQPTSFGGNAIPADPNGYIVVGVNPSNSLAFNVSGFPLASVAGYESNQSPDYYVLQTPGQKIRTSAGNLVYSLDGSGNALATSANQTTLLGRLPQAIPFDGSGFVKANTQATAGSLTFNLTGDLSGSVGSVAGSVGSVTAAVTLAGSTITSIQSGLATAAGQTTIETAIASLGSPMQANAAVVLAASQPNYAPLLASSYAAPDNADIVTALADLITLLARTDPTSALSAINGITSKLATTIVQIGSTGNYQFTASALALAPSGGGGGGGGETVINVQSESLRVT